MAKATGKNRALRSLIYLRYDSETACAEALGWKKQKLNKMTNGLMEPDINDARKLAKALGVSVDVLADFF